MRLSRIGLAGFAANSLPNIVFAEVCDKVRPDWNGVPVTPLQEALVLASTLPTLVLFIATLLAVRFRHQWAALVVVVLWSLFVTLLALPDRSGVQQVAANEGCIGSPTLFIVAVAAICVATILYTAPISKSAT